MNQNSQLVHEGVIERKNERTSVERFTPVRSDYLMYARFCAVSGVTGGPVEEMNGIPIPAQLLWSEPKQ
jgi:hypothetical protein